MNQSRCSSDGAFKLPTQRKPRCVGHPPSFEGDKVSLQFGGDIILEHLQAGVGGSPTQAVNLIMAGRLVKGGALTSNEREEQIYGSPQVFQRCRADKKFAYVVALARAVNALNSAHSLMVNTGGSQTPAAIRDRMNSYFFVSGILYESLRLIRSMTRVFSGDKSFEANIRLILKDTSGQGLEEMHLKPVRHGGVFHFVADRFADAIAETPMDECVFLSSVGRKRGEVHYGFADLITAEIGAGTRLDNEVAIQQMMEKTLDLVKKFIGHSENFIGDQLNGWGFEIRDRVVTQFPRAPKAR